MKNKIILIPGFLLAMMLFNSCNKDFLSTVPKDSISSDAVWGDGPLATGFVTEIYNGLGPGGFNEQMLSSISDETIFVHPGRGIDAINNGSLSPSNLGWVDGTYEWKSMYNRIRSCNLALLNLPTATFDDDPLKERLKGEAHFMRAYYYHQLLRYYGSVPIIDKIYGLNEDYSVERATFEQCVNFIAADCDTAIQYLTGKTLGKGRATELAAKALKSRLLLYAASDLHDIPTAKANSSVIAAYSKPEFLGYLSGDRTARWQAAKDAAKAVLDEGSGYKLDLAAPVSTTEAFNNYLSISMGGGSKAPGVDASASNEIIFGRYIVPDKDEWGGASVGLFNGPNGYHNWAGNAPVGLMVDDYEMMDGTPFNWNNPAQKAAPYENRDPRFYASILYDGSNWKPRDKISGNVDPANQIQTGAYDLKVAGALTIFQGLDTRNSTIEDWNGTATNYYMRKFTDPDPAIVDNNTHQYVPWPFFRYTEAIFNYAEASIELGQETEAKTWLNKIRFRSGMPAITESGAALKARYRNERRIEMAFEEQRYHDARRWMIAPTTLGRDVTFIHPLGKFKPGKELVGTYHYDKSIYDYTYTTEVNTSLEDRTWDDKMYFRPIGRDEINKNTKLVQNPGYQ
ncbi:MAG TPA: RagB/SusD family nutrient uptake outer membrane protein [Chitinophagaceae bacterium]|nr:RagB/SusD family nutrient uptake outer membrane protein [Chitinophagaceae bacterium]